ncbi:DUF6597 domain-containing transcriptional factor [Pedobacter sp. V48]|uniref:DUF6597 domain-containing transcriptional factor n=1 Tax=Pedobacter sp. V48 TaxID=509635 RepID=UPI0003E5435F|nr:DUF6597 domain-containing transcriptional factor [Pedobacter sp. V48]ETZ21423.1 hypothetical protein N824_28555 [Pedobacter sp. V48]
MKAKILSPNETVCEYVTEIMVMQNDPGVKISSMPIFAYGVPYLIFKTKKGILGTKNTGYLTLFGQTITPTYLTIEDDFIIIVYYFKPFALLTLFRTSAKELTDNPTDLLLVNSRYGRELQERLLNSVSVNDMIELLDHYIYSLIVESKVQTQLIYATTRFAYRSII